MGRRTASSWSEVGERVAAARKAAGVTQDQLAAAVKIDRSAVSRIENGERELDVLELRRLAEALKRPLNWFLSLPLPTVSSRRASLPAREPHEVDEILETAVHGVELLIDMEVLGTATFALDRALSDVRDAELASAQVRRHLASEDSPLWNLAAAAEALGVLSFSLSLADPRIDGAYSAAARCGVAIVNGIHDSGRRRFTLAHEIGHHVLQDEYVEEWDTATGKDARERLINAFAIHLLAPRAAVTQAWSGHQGSRQPRLAALKLAAEFGVSWTALCAHLMNLNLIERDVHADLFDQPPVGADYIENEIVLREDLRPPAVPPRYAAAVVRAYRTQRIGRRRAVELLFASLSEKDLPRLDRVPLEALGSELKAAK